MGDLFDFVSSPQGMATLNGFACLLFATFAIAAVRRKPISLGSLVPSLERAGSPTAYWSIVSLHCVIAVWTGVTVALALMRAQ
jgi:hypothetical protein